jgi:hypothetical protein
MGSPLVWTAATAVTAVRNTIGDPAGAATTRWSATEIDGYLNRAQLSVVRDCEVSLETSWTADITAGTREYKMPSSFYKTESADWIHVARTDIRHLRPVSYAYYRDVILRDETTQDEPQVYYFWRKLGDDPTTSQPTSIYLHPTPNFSTAAGNDFLEVHGYKYPDTIDSTGAPTKVLELEPPYVEAAVMWACYLILSDDGDPRATEKLRTYELLVEKTRSAMARKDLSTASRLRPKGSRYRSLGSVVDDWIRW